MKRFINTASTRLRALRVRDTVLEDIDEEMRLHIEMETEANMRQGMSPEDAHRTARKSFGNVGRLRDAAYDVRGGGVLETFLQDVRFAARSLLKQKRFTAIAVLTLALGIGANSAIFSVVNELLLQPLPYPDSDRLVMLWETTPDGDRQNTTSRANFSAWRAGSTSFEKMAAFTDQRINLTGVGEPEEVSIQLATPELLAVLGVEPMLGRGFSEADGRTGAMAVTLLGHGLWQRRFGGDPTIVGRAIMLNGAPHTVIGVLPAGFRWFVRARSGTGRPPELWSILDMPTEEGAATRGRFLSTVARLKKDVPIEQASAELGTIAARLEREAPRFNTGYGVEIVELREQLVGNVRPALLILLGAVGFVLLIACANVANLLLSRAAARAREMALRAALGAGRWRIVRQLLTESFLLAALGSVLGLFLAWWGIQALVAISPPDLLAIRDVGLDITVLAWTIGISLLTGVVFGLAPALEATRLNLNEALKEGSKGSEGQSARSGRLRSMLVVAEVALALVLLAGAGLLVRSFIGLQQIDPGFEPDNVLTMVVRLSEGRYTEDRQLVSFFRDATGRIGNLAGVEAVGAVNFLPFYGGLGANTGFTIDGRPTPPPGSEPGVDVRVSDPGYFEAIGIPMLKGRNFSEIEASEARHVVIISSALAEKHFPGEDPIGRHISVAMFPEPTPAEIIGVVGDVKPDRLEQDAVPTVYFPHAELSYPFMTLVIRTKNDPTEIVSAVRNEIRKIDPDQPLSDVRTMNGVMADALSRARFNTLLLGLFALLATLLAAVGIFGVMNYAVTLRTREIGLRMALGAQPSEVLGLVLKQGAMLTLVGIVIGLAGALLLTRLLSSLLVGVDATDPLTLSAIVIVLAAVSLLACYIPARRATRVDPMVALRYE